MKEIQQRTQMFIDQSVRYEKEAAQQVESVKLSSESASMAAQAELANARREAATAAANHKTALANWQGELDLHKAEAATLRREIERIENERDRAREDSRRADTAKAAMEVEVKEARKMQIQRDRELQVDKNSTAQQLYEAKEMFERQKTALEHSLVACTARAEEAEATVATLKVQFAEAQAAVQRLEGELVETQAARDGLAAEKVTLNSELAGLREQLNGHLQQHEKVVGDSAAVANELGEWKKKAADLLAELEKERSAAAEAALAAGSAAEASAADKASIEAKKSELEAAVAKAAAREQALTADREELKAALDAAIAQRSEAELAAAGAAEKLQNIESEAASLADERASLSEETAKLREESAAARRQAETAEETLARVSRDAEETAAKLEHLEGQLEALQECTMGLQVGDQRELLSRMVSKIATLEAAVVNAEARRREAHNQLVELKGNIRVFCRIRPHARPIALPGNDGSSVRVLADNKEHAFAFDRVFKPQMSQAAIFDEVSDVVQSALDGYKVCLFSYGQTGAGKTHTMQGGRGPGEEGIIPRAVSKILATVARLREQGWEYSLEASYIEVYNEQLRDLLGGSGGRISESNAIQHQPNGGHTIVLGAARVQVDSEADAEELIRKAAAARAVESTAMNAVSSRSHSVFMLYITGKHEATTTCLQGSLNLVDLAGSERLARSQAEGQRAREACSINKSLSSLGDVFAALSAKQTHIPYRNSKLTHLLQPCLGGTGKTLMFVNINPEPESSGESLCSLRFAAKVNACETAAKGGASRNVGSSITTTENSNNGNTSGAVGGSGLFRTTSAGLDARPSLTGRASVAVGANSNSAAAGARRMSMIPSAGAKRSAMGPPAPTASRVARPKFN
jgi:predicted  nucleic acid-binding Zn-ribbon protein